jgi:TPP-dependent pyruvate/acetoin dehydrogenase alpha subunit
MVQNVNWSMKAKERKVESETGKKYKGEEAIKRIKEYLTEWNISSEMTEEEIRDVILATFNSDGLEEIEMKVKFSNGTKREVEE